MVASASALVGGAVEGGHAHAAEAEGGDVEVSECASFHAVRGLAATAPLTQIVRNTGTLAAMPAAIKRSLVSDQVFRALSEEILGGPLRARREAARPSARWPPRSA